MYDVVILAGGMGTRLKSVSGNIPKPMVDVSGEPFLYRLMKYVEQQGFKKIILSLSYKADYIIDKVLKDNPVNCQIDFVVENEPLGTGGAIKFASTYVKTDKFVVINGDTYCEINYEKFIDSSLDSDLQISGIEIEDVNRYGSLDIDEESNVLSIVEKGRTGKGIINSGIYIISKDALNGFAVDKFSFENDFLTKFEGVFKAFVSQSYFIDIGIPDDYYKSCEKFK